MSDQYDHQKFEEQWQSFWQKKDLFQKANQATLTPEQQKSYLLFAFAYPSGSGLHVGHVESKTALDIQARFKRMNGEAVYFPVGWDAFGLPAENYAIKTGVPPATTTKNAINSFRRQVQRLGISYDWANEIATNHPEYYRWTQWLFLQMYKKGMAYQGLGMVNWCPSCQTVLANEQVVNGKCERCGSEVIQKELKQWYFKITNYTEELISGLEKVDWPTPTKEQQLHWIGKNNGLQVDFKIKDSNIILPIWTKFWETIYGTTFLVIAPEKFKELNLLDLVPENHKVTVERYLDQAAHKTEEERKIGEKNKTGALTGITVINPVNQREVPLYIADYVLLGVGTAIVMGVPSHDQRDFDFAKKYDLPLQQVVSFADPEKEALVTQQSQAVDNTGDGKDVLVNSGEFNGLDSRQEGKQKIAEWIIAQKLGRWQTTYKLRDWLISRQRYWGAPIPIVYDPEGNAHQVKEEHLPWMLPTDVDFKPTGESPLKRSKEFFERTERLYGKGWTPECDTMDTFVDSSWYFLRYTDARNTTQFADPEKLAKWLPVDMYLIGPEHIVLHLLYARFFTKFLRDEGYLKIDEPFAKMRHQGMILGPDGKKMSKSKGNVITPDEVIEKFGADTLRMYEMFMGPLESDKPWDTGSVVGVYRLLSRIYSYANIETAANEDAELTRALHIVLKKVTEDIPQMKFNTAIAAIMMFVNAWEVAQKRKVNLTQSQLEQLIKLLAPFAPFLAEELYHRLPNQDAESVHLTQWPKFDPALAVQPEVTITVQVDGKVRGQFQVSSDAAGKDAEASVTKQASELPALEKWLADRKIVKTIFVPGRLVNFVTTAI